MAGLVFFTGFPGFIGTRLVGKILSADPQIRVAALVESKMGDRARDAAVRIDGGDRIDVLESALRSLVTLRPDNPITETGVLAELKRHGLSSRLGHKRADVKHHWMDPLIVGAPWAGVGAATYLTIRRVRRRP